MVIETTYPAWKAGILTVVLHLLIKESTHSSKYEPSSSIKTTILFPSPCVTLQCGLFGRHGIYRKSSVLLYNTICFRLMVFFVLNSFEQHIRIELTSPAWQAGTLTVVLMLLIKHTRTNWIRTSTDCRIKTFRSTVLHLQGPHPFPSRGESIPNSSSQSLSICVAEWTRTTDLLCIRQML